MLSRTEDLLDPFSTFDFARHPAIVAAVSGGSDSTALLLLLHDHLRRLGASTRVVGVTIDHRLRQGSDAEAEGVARLCAKLGLSHRTLAWRDEKPATGLASAARDARARLLVEAARQEGATLIATGHTADDQAETVAMRRARGDGPGLAGIAAATLLDGRIWTVRPLLRTRRAALRDFLEARAIGWIDDPSNEDPAFERSRVRRDLAGAVEPLLAIAAEVGLRRAELAERAADLIEGAVRSPLPGVVRLDARPMLEPGAAAIHALRVMVAVAGGAVHLPEQRQALRLCGALRGGAVRATLGGTLLAARGGALWLARELRGMPGPAAARDGEIWDGRFRLSGHGDATVRAAGPGASDACQVDEAPPAVVLRAANAARPVFDGIGRDGWTTEAVAAPWARRLPIFDLPVALAVASVLGLTPPPEPPWARHIVIPA